MNTIAQRITATPATNPAEMALRIKQEAPTLADLNNEQLEQIARLVMTQRLAAELHTAVNLAGIDWQKEKAVFLENAGKEQSGHTRRGYSNALGKLEAWAAGQKINPLELTALQADDFIYSLKAAGSASASVRLTAAAASSFYTFLHRRHKEIDNPFRGTKARPKDRAARPLAIPSAGEVETILHSPPADFPADLLAAVSIMAFMGLRAGALPGLSIKGDRFTSRSKGKDISGDIPAEITDHLKAAALPLRDPFAGRTTNSLELAIAYYIKKLFREGKLAASYSCHDFRHYFAVSHYRKHRDIYALQKALNHSSIAVTEKYLRGLGEI